MAAPGGDGPRGGTLTKAKAKKQTKGKPPKRGLPWFAWLLIALAIAGVVVFIRICPMGQPSPDNVGKPKAAIVDQLSSLQPNETFISQITNELEDYGFEVDIYKGNNVTVEFYRRLPSYGYKLIVFRGHSGLLEINGELTERTLLFTNEPYSKTKYFAEQLSDQLAMVRVTEGDPWVFGVGSKFISQSMEGEFDNTVIIITGCSCLYIKDLASAFVDKGASAYLAWDASVDLDYVDRATAYLIEQLCTEKVTIEKAVTSTMNVIGPDPKYKAVLKYFPAQNGNQTLKELVSRSCD